MSSNKKIVKDSDKEKMKPVRSLNELKNFSKKDERYVKLTIITA